MIIQTTAQMILNAFNRNNDADRLVCDYESLGDIGEDVQNAVMDAHAGRLPNDTSYELCCAALEYISDNDCDDDSAYDFAESATPFSSHELLAWICAHADNLALADEVLEDGVSSITQAASMGYEIYAASVFRTMLDLVESLSEDEE